MHILFLTCRSYDVVRSWQSVSFGAAVFFMTQEKCASCVFCFFFFNVFLSTEFPLSTRCVLNSKCILQVQLAAGAITTKNLLIVVQVQLRLKNQANEAKVC